MKYNDNGIWKDLTVKVSDTLPIGTVIPFAGNTVPSDWMVCDGSAISRTIYSTLFGVIGTTYGEGDGSTTFNLPNLQGKVVVGVDSNDEDFDTLGETGGEKTHTLTVDEIPSHKHGIRDTTDMSTRAGQSHSAVVGGGTTWNVGDTYLSANTGGGQSHNNLQPYQVLNYIIKVLDAPAIQAQVVNNENDSKLNAYSCDYINNKVKDVYSTDEVKTNKVWIDGKPIYRKVYEGTSVDDISFIIDASLKSGTTVLTDCGGYFSQRNRGEKMNVGGYLNQNWYNGIYLDPDGLKAYISTALRNSPYKVWVEYTKTTD